MIAACNKPPRAAKRASWTARPGTRNGKAVRADVEEPPPASPKRDGELSDQEIEYWMEVFDDIDERNPRWPRDHRQQGLPDIIDDDFEV